ncbi:sensory/regulatory protein RpfC [Lachnospiraceae bacterium]|nr:sensory/regulatory protein RpfC [Lachnospiraceae bacterium]
MKYKDIGRCQKNHCRSQGFSGILKVTGYMEKREGRSVIHKKMALIIPIILVFGILGTVVFSVSRRISLEMSESAIGNLHESLDLIGNTMETILKKEAEFQELIAQELVDAEDPAKFVRSYKRNGTMVKISLIMAGEKSGVSNTGEEFSEEELDFSGGKTVGDLPVSSSYVNDMGTWAYTMKCPVMKNGTQRAWLYIEYVYDSFDDALPSDFYNGSATLYLMDSYSKKFVMKPKGIGERDAGHMNLEDFYRANKILEEDVKANVIESIDKGNDVMFYHDIQNKESLIYMWSVNEGAVYLIGYVPVQAIQREGDAVNQNILIVVAVMLTAFFGSCALYLFFDKLKDKIRQDQETERELHNKQLTEALQTAQIANNSKTTFLSNMSHDIRTPMNAILGFATLLAKDVDNPDKVREYTRKITSSGQHLLSLINDVLDISKIESGKVVLSLGEIAINDIISSIDAIIRPAANAKNQTFDIAVTGLRHERLIGDETRINQILINLLSNAVKYTPEGGNIWLRIIGLNQYSSQYEHVRIEVEDNGYGMTSEYLETIFDAFTRAENSTTNKVQGTGLGMAITKNIVELMGGTIEVASEVGLGSLFIVDLELRIPEIEVDEQFWKDRGISRILVVDDEADICENVKILMEGAGIQVDTANEGEEALHMRQEACENGSDYQVILLDLKMPGMDGLETARQMRTMISGHVPILLLTSYDWEEIQTEAVQAGIDGFLSKPFFVSALKEKVIELLADQTMEEEASAGQEESSLAGRHFLVAEDNEINAEILTELLDIEEATCEIVENGRLAVERFAQTEPGSYDAILMDVQMPVMNGYEAARAIRQMDRADAKMILIIAMTANAFAEDVKDAIDAGMDAHIAKPVDMELLRRTLGLYFR